MGMMKEFREFAVKGNVVDMAVGIIIGGAFGTVVKSFVSDVMMPPLGLLVGDVDFQDIFVTLREGTVAGPYETLEAAREVGAVTVNVGLFIDSVVSFAIVAFAVFMLIKAINRMKREEEAAPPPPDSKDCPHCFTTIAIQATRCPHCTSEIAAA